ncbi:MAG: MFS transporter [Steroidobacteraceae bacterium]
MSPMPGSPATPASASAPSATSAPPWPSAAAAWGMIAVLFFASMVSTLDRALINLVVDPLKHDLVLTDVQISLLQGLAFGIFYATVGLPVGLAADRYSRRGLIIAGVSVWSLATMASGYVASFGELFAARLLVGLGEAALSPAAISLIADLFPPEKRGRPIGVFLMGQALANGVAISTTSFVVEAAARGGFAGVPWLAGLAPWRVAFVLAGTLGVLVVGGLLLAREPVRRRALAGAPSAQAGSADQFGAHALACLRFLRSRAAVFVPLYLGFALVFVAVYGAAAWTPTMLMRGFGATRAEVGQWLGPLSMTASILGAVVGGTIIDRSARRGAKVGHLGILALVPFLIIPSGFAVLAPGFVASAVLVASANLFVPTVSTGVLATLQSSMPPDMRGLSVALTGLVNTLLGATFGPLIIAALTDRVFVDPAAVGYSIGWVVVPSLLLASAAFAWARRELARG